MFCYNKQHEDVLEFVRTLDADVLCMQEVPASLLAKLEALFPHSAHVVDSERVRGGSEWTNYNVILSKYPLSDVRTVLFDPLPHPLRTHVTIFLMRPLGWAYTYNRSAVAARVKTPTGDVQVFSTHLTLASPASRAQEFAKVLSIRDESCPTVIAGDFNILESWYIKPLCWLFGAHIGESMPWYPERALFEKRFTDAQLINPLKGHVTHRISQSQLDHVLVSHSLTVDTAHVHAELYGSDHNPISVELKTAKSI
jgi:endonuclease/exonuclease/phosphatase family metal-dependent hydrolase